MELPFDIVNNILLGLPVKVLSKFRCVSKAWSSLISDPRFQKAHNSRAQENRLFLVANGEYRTNSHFITYRCTRLTTYNNQGDCLRWFFSDRIPNFSIIQSSLGLVCLHGACKQLVGLCNPSTEEIIFLPELSEEKSNGLQCLGFGFAASSEVYKVVIFFALDPDDDDDGLMYQVATDNFCEVFTFPGTDSWRESRRPPHMFRFEEHAPFLHGALHMLPDVRLIEHKDQYIAAFDLDMEEYREIPFPEIYFGFHSVWSRDYLSERFLRLAELGGSLCLTFNLALVGKHMLELWFLVDYHGSHWVKQYNIDLSSMDRRIVTPRAVWTDGHLLIHVSGIDDKKFCLYDTQKNCFTGFDRVFQVATFYFESFFPLQGSRRLRSGDIYHMDSEASSKA